MKTLLFITTWGIILLCFLACSNGDIQTGEKIVPGERLAFDNESFVLHKIERGMSQNEVMQIVQREPDSVEQKNGRTHWIFELYNEDKSAKKGAILINLVSMYILVYVILFKLLEAPEHFGLILEPILRALDII